MWKSDWDLARQRLVAWWECKGPALYVTAPLVHPRAQVPLPQAPPDLEATWIDPVFRRLSAEYEMAHTHYAGVAFPYFDTQVGPGSLGLFLGSDPGFAPDTVWYEPCIQDPDNHPPLSYEPHQKWLQAHEAIIQEGLSHAQGRYLVGMPDLVENVDTLAQLRDPQTLMLDLAERPDWVERKVWEINDAYIHVFQRFFDQICDEWGGNAFSAFKIWGPGKTAKVQCDAAAMFSPQMFHRFVVPALESQCAWLDYAMFHLDGTQCLVHLDLLLDMQNLQAIEWTPQAGLPTGGSHEWYNLYRRILAGGKAVQAIQVEFDEVLPLLDAVGHEGMFVMATAPTAEAADRLVEQVYG